MADYEGVLAELLKRQKALEEEYNDLDQAIGLAFVDPGVDDWFEVLIRNNPVPAKAVPLPFYKRNRG